MKRSEQLINMIREEGIEPHPRSRFVRRRILLWLGFGLAIILGALAFSVVLFAIQQVDFSLLQHVDHSRLELFLALLPFAWLILLAVFLVLAMYALRQSPRGYKLDLLRLAGYSTALSIVLGTILFLAGGAGQLEQAFASRISLYESVEEKKAQLWSMPDDGYLSGTIVARTESTFTLTDFAGETWTIDYTESFLPPIVELVPNERIKLIGKVTGDGLFKAEEIRPWGGRRRRGGGNAE